MQDVYKNAALSASRMTTAMTWIDKVDKTVLPFDKKMQEMKLVDIEDEIFQRYRPKIRKMKRLSPGLNSETAITL